MRGRRKKGVEKPSILPSKLSVEDFLNQLKFRQLRYHYLLWPHILKLKTLFASHTKLKGEMTKMGQILFFQSRGDFQ